MSFSLSDLCPVNGPLFIILQICGLEFYTLIPGMTIAASSCVVLFAVGTFLVYGGWSLAGWFSLWFFSFSFNISGFIRFVIRGYNSGRNFQVHQFIVDVIVGKVFLGLEVINDIIH